MADTTFVDGQTTIIADWLNDVNDGIYGNASVPIADKIKVVPDNSSISYSVTFASTGNGNADLYSDASIAYNPSQNTIETGFVKGTGPPLVAEHLTRKDYVDARTGGLITKVIEIGDWDMTAIQTLSVPHVIADFTKIRSINALIRSDTISVFSNFLLGNSILDNGQHHLSCNTVNIILTRANSGDFDNVNYSATSFNRGWITIQYTD